ncbi:MAG: hypothetical protein KAU58_02890, partial [Candidatus Omnitrophica bacterium]|nr:hypothetical protein [Candidatus Omnitrophota bacterium]
QLSKRSYLENMYAQYAENLPGVVIDEKAKKIFVDTKHDLFGDDIEKVLQKYMDNDLEFFSVGEKYAEGLYKFLDMKETLSANRGLKFLKGQITGPVSFGLTVKDASGKSIMYLKEFEELIPKFLGMKARWQVKKLKELNEKVIIFIDEPYLTSIGSSYVSINKGKTLTAINEMVSLIKQEGAISGLHCCGNTEWDFLLKSNIDILSFDAYNYMKEFLLYAEDIKNFLNKGKTIAWGIIPTNKENLEKEDAKSLINKMIENLDKLKEKGIDAKLLSTSSIITPSCGCGTLTVEDCEKIFDVLDSVSKELKNFCKK